MTKTFVWDVNVEREYADRRTRVLLHCSVSTERMADKIISELKEYYKYWGESTHFSKKKTRVFTSVDQFNRQFNKDFVKGDPSVPAGYTGLSTIKRKK